MAFCLYKASPLLPRLQEEVDAINSLMQEDVSGLVMLFHTISKGTVSWKRVKEVLDTEPRA